MAAEKKTVSDLISAVNNNSERRVSSIEDSLYISDKDKELQVILNDVLNNEAVERSLASYSWREVLLQTELNERMPKQNFVLLEVSEDKDEQIISYEIDSTRYTLHYFKDGTIIKSVTSFRDDGSFEFNQNFNNEQNTTVDSNELPVINYEQDQEGLDTINEQQAVFASAKLVDPYPLRGKETSAVLKLSTTRVFSELEKLKFTATQPVKVYESSKYFSEKSKSTTIFDVKSSIDLAANWWNIATTSAKGFYNVAGVALDTYGYIQEKSEPVREHEYSFQGGIEVTVYDPTYEKTNVEVVNEWGQGIYTLTFDRAYNSFANAKWGISAIPNPFNKLYGSHADEAQRIYNSNIALYKTWKHGVGQLGY